MKLKTAQRVKGTNSKFDAKKLGKLSEQIDETDEVSFSDRNLEGDKLVGVFVYEEGADDDTAPFAFYCSKRLSKTVRKALSNGHSQENILTALMTLEVIENDKGQFIAPNGEKKARIKVKDLIAKGNISYADLQAYGK